MYLWGQAASPYERYPGIDKNGKAVAQEQEAGPHIKEELELLTWNFKFKLLGYFEQEYNKF